MKQLLLVVLGCVAIASCSEKENNDKEAPIVTLTAPTANEVVNPGTIRIKGTVTDNAYIGQIHIEVYSGANTEVKHTHIHPGTKSFAFDEPMVVQAGINYRIKVIVDDPAANSSFTEVNISCN